MTKKIIFTMMAILTMMATTSCKGEQKTTEDPNDGFVTINESWNDGWSGSNVQTWDDVDEQILTEQIITEQIITEQIIVETTVTETYVHENFEPVYIDDEYQKNLEFNSKKNVYFGETTD